MANVSSSNGLEKHPKLRFKGFSEPWEVGTAEELFDNVVDKNHPEETVLTIIQGQGTLPRDAAGRNIHYDTESLSGYKRVMKNDYVIHLRSFEGGLEIANSQGIVSPAYTILRSKKPCAPLFFDSYFHTDEFINHVLYKAVEGIRDGRQISYEAFKWLSIPYCSLEEQTKIAEFLEKLNLRIEKQRTLVEHLKKYKRGVSNTFFNDKVVAECSAVLPFGQAVEINPKTKSLPTEFIYIDLESVESGKLLHENIISRDNAPSRAQRVLSKGDVLFQMVRPYQKNNFYFEAELSLPSVASTGYAQIRCDENDPTFVFEQISSDYFANQAMLRSTGTGYPAINSDSLAEIPFIKLPLSQQKKIGEFLYSLGKRIAREEDVLNRLYDIKSALLRNLFI